MFKQHSTPLRDVEKFEAFEIMANETLQVFESPDLIDDRVLTMGKYLLTCTVLSPEDSYESIQKLIAGGLKAAGGIEKDADEISEFIMDLDNLRAFTNFLNFPTDEFVPGVRPNKKTHSTKHTFSFDEKIFVRAIIKNKN